MVDDFIILQNLVIFLITRKIRENHQCAYRQYISLGLDRLGRPTVIICGLRGYVIYCDPKSQPNQPPTNGKSEEKCGFNECLSKLQLRCTLIQDQKTFVLCTYIFNTIFMILCACSLLCTTKSGMRIFLIQCL